MKDPNSKLKTRIGYVMSGLVIAFMLFDSAMKIAAMDVVLKSSAELGYPATAAFARELGIVALICTALYAWPRTAILGAILLAAYMGGTVATHLRAGNPLFSHMLFGVYLALLAWGGLYLREPRLRALLPLRTKRDTFAVPTEQNNEYGCRERIRPMTDAGAISFHAEILRADKTATGIEIPGEIIERLGAGKKPPVKITINGYTYRSTVAVMGGRYMVGVNAENREKAKVAGGDHVEVTIAVDREPREVTIPPALAAILNRDPRLRKAFDGLSYTNRRVIAEGIAGAKADETRQRRIDKAIADLERAAAKG